MQEHIESSNQAFEYINSHQKHLEVKMSQYSCGNIIIIFFIIILFMLKSGHYAGINWCSNYSIMTKSYAGTLYVTRLSGGLKHPISWGLGGGMCGVLILPGASYLSNQDMP